MLILVLWVVVHGLVTLLKKLPSSYTILILLHYDVSSPSLPSSPTPTPTPAPLTPPLPPPHQKAIEKPPYEVTETGWGEFDIIIKIFFIAEAAEKPITFTHHLKLHPWPILDTSLLVPRGLSLSGSNIGTPGAGETKEGATPSGAGGGGGESMTALVLDDPLNPPVLSPIHSWQYEEIVFGEPTETFYSILLSRPPTPLPKANRHPRVLNLALGGGGNFGEFTEGMEKDEGDKLDKAKMKVLEEIEKLRDRLITKEKELSG